MQLTEAQKKYLRGLGHSKKPVVMIGQHGLKETILEEIEQALTHHELIKIKISVGDHGLRDDLITQIVEASRATRLQRIGNILLLFRRNTLKPRIDLKLARR